MQPGRDNLRVTLPGGGGPGLLLLGHTDVVPVGEGWTKDPFGGVDRGRPHIRPRRLGHERWPGGVRFRRWRHCGAPSLRGPVELAALVDEEENGIGIRAYVASATTRSFLGCITAEPTDLQTIVGARGAAYLRVDVHGTACHAGDPDNGANAIYGAAEVVAEIERMHAELAERRHPLLGPCDVERRPDQGRQRRQRGGRRVRRGRRSPAAARRVGHHGAATTCVRGSRHCGWPIVA